MAVKPPDIAGSVKMQLEQYVVRAGLAHPETLMAGTGPHRDIPDLYGFSVQSASGVSVDELARGGGFRHGWISIATIAELRWLG